MEWKIELHVLQDITNTATMNHSIIPKEVQKGKGMNYKPMNVSIAAANNELELLWKRLERKWKKVDNEKIDPLKFFISSFPLIKQSIDVVQAVLVSLILLWVSISLMEIIHL